VKKGREGVEGGRRRREGKEKIKKARVKC